jgi:hypothetical protein
MSNGKAKLVVVGEDGDSPTAYIAVKNDLNKDIDSYIKNDSNRSSVLQKMKNEDLKKLLEKTGKDLKKSDALQINEGAINKYQPEMFYEEPEETTAPAADADAAQ